MAKNHQTPQKIAKSANIKTFLQSLPFNGISKLVMTGISIILTVIISSANEMETKSLQCILHVTIYISFSISGLLDILIFYSPEDIIPKQSDSLSLVINVIRQLHVKTTKQNNKTYQPYNYCG